jgi:hypothetical protein
MLAKRVISRVNEKQIVHSSIKFEYTTLVKGTTESLWVMEHPITIY